MKAKIRKYLSGKSLETEQKELLVWLRKDNHVSEFQAVKREWKDEIIQEELPSEYQQNWSEIQHTIHLRTQTELFVVRRSLRFFQYAAIFILLISVPAIIYMTQFQTTTQKQELVYTTVAADFGQISKVILPDSTVIWVNSGSTLTYNNQFSATNREIKLTGEAFFKVTKNKDLPLIVSSEDLRIKVLGTEFCVSAYPEEDNIQVVLEKGKVELSSSTHANFKQEMKPGELASFNKEKKELTLSTVNTGLYTSWKDGLINFYNLPLSEVVIKLEKRYNQKFVVDDAIKNLPFTFTIKNENLNHILSLMEKITPVDAIQHGNAIELKYNKFKTVPKMN
ncbi:MAG: FecR family protein [Bacteroidota bacterium]|nr:FecR family protein [Bacteroidota bacterium]